MSKPKYLMVLEQSESKLSVEKQGKEYVLEGVFTELGVRNNNGRVYEEDQVLPQIERMQAQIKGRTLLGELDHPQSFEVKMKNASHIIEELRYDKDKRQVIGRIRLLPTSNGKEAMAFVDAGIPLHISSRSAGIVESSGKVKLKQMFTYDIVHTPGFGNAQLAPVNESYGFSKEGPVGLFEVSEEEASLIEALGSPEAPGNNRNTTKNVDYISREDFNKYTELVKASNEKAFEKLRAELNEAKTALAAVPADEGVEAKAINEKVAAMEKTIANLIEHNNYIIENLAQVKGYAELIAKGVNENAAEAQANHDNIVGYAELIREHLNKSIEYHKYVVNETNSRFRYQGMVNEHVDALISHSDYLSESVDSVIKYTSTHLRENIVSLGESLDSVQESITLLKESKAAPAATVEPTTTVETVTESTEEVKVDDVDAKLAEVLGEGAAEPAAYTKEPFFRLLSKERRDELVAMEDGKRNGVLEAFSKNKYYGSVDVARIWENATAERKPELNWLSDAPAKYKAIWESMTPAKRSAIKAQATVRDLRTEYAIQNFWDTRDLRNVVVRVNENDVNAIPQDADATYTTNTSWREAVEKGLSERFKR